MPDLGRLTEDLYFCPGCHAGDHVQHEDLFPLRPFGTVSCHCQLCEPYPT